MSSKPCPPRPEGSLSLETVPLKAALKSEAASWKAQFAHKLHSQSAEDLRSFDAYIRRAARLFGFVLFLRVRWLGLSGRRSLQARSPRACAWLCVMCALAA
jgi:hypothetical protein